MWKQVMQQNEKTKSQRAWAKNAQASISKKVHTYRDDKRNTTCYLAAAFVMKILNQLFYVHR